MSTSREMVRARIFMFNWTLAVLATVCAFVVHLAMRGRTVSEAHVHPMDLIKRIRRLTGAARKKS